MNDDKTIIVGDYNDYTLFLYFVNDLDKSNIKYKRTKKYFRYKYDNKKLMDTSEEEKNNNGNGYVLAGKYNYSLEDILKDN